MPKPFHCCLGGHFIPCPSHFSFSMGYIIPALWVFHSQPFGYFIPCPSHFSFALGYFIPPLWIFHSLSLTFSFPSLGISFPAHWVFHSLSWAFSLLPSVFFIPFSGYFIPC